MTSAAEITFAGFESFSEKFSTIDLAPPVGTKPVADLHAVRTDGDRTVVAAVAASPPRATVPAGTDRRRRRRAGRSGSRRRSDRRSPARGRSCSRCPRSGSDTVALCVPPAVASPPVDFTSTCVARITLPAASIACLNCASSPGFWTRSGRSRRTRSRFAPAAESLVVRSATVVRGTGFPSFSIDLPSKPTTTTWGSSARPGTGHRWHGAGSRRTPGR